MFSCKTLSLFFIKDWFELSVSHLFLISHAGSPVRLPPHWASAVHTPWALVIRGRLLISVIRSDCCWPACTLSLIENLQMRPERLAMGRSVHSCWPSRTAGCQSRALGAQTTTLEVNFLIQWSKLWFCLCVSWCSVCGNAQDTVRDGLDRALYSIKHRNLYLIFHFVSFCLLIYMVFDFIFLHVS